MKATISMVNALSKWMRDLHANARILTSILTMSCFVHLLGGCATAPPSAAGGAATEGTTPYASTILSEGDVIRIGFEADTNLNTIAQIQLDGTVTLPLLGAVPAAGKAPEELRADLMKRYEKLLSINELTVTVINSVASVYVSGAVLKPGRIPLVRPMTALEAIMEAGGPDIRRAKLKAVTVLRREEGRQRHFTLNLQDALRGHDPNPFYLKPFDILHVPEKRFNF
ncbi:MAG: polysaccharide biosynthesis/export family protein [Verrucomicrobiota bacterium]|nr:polysaccharide export protein [Limisphaera sp.]MDW8383040.1 polysaccharide biosynthesis/export family protein [Verrucomicrobiota bacterium]